LPRYTTAVQRLAADALKDIKFDGVDFDVVAGAAGDNAVGLCTLNQADP
jgi:hypothetical protein